MARFRNVDAYWAGKGILRAWHFEEAEQAIFEAFCDFRIEARSIELHSNCIEVFQRSPVQVNLVNLRVRILQPKYLKTHLSCVNFVKNSHPPEPVGKGTNGSLILHTSSHHPWNYRSETSFGFVKNVSLGP
jgi:hypothetical protein